MLNAGTVSAQTFTLGSNDKLTIGIDQLATIDLPASGTGPFTPETNPNKGDLLLGNFGGVIANFSSGDTIDVDTYLSSASAGTLSQNGSLVSVIEIANGDTLGVLRFDTAANAVAAITDDAITLVPCFAAGTRIDDRARRGGGGGDHRGWRSGCGCCWATGRRAMGSLECNLGRAARGGGLRAPPETTKSLAGVSGGGRVRAEPTAHGELFLPRQTTQSISTTY